MAQRGHAVSSIDSLVQGMGVAGHHGVLGVRTPGPGGVPRAGEEFGHPRHPLKALLCTRTGEASPSAASQSWGEGVGGMCPTGLGHHCPRGR